MDVGTQSLDRDQFIKIKILKKWNKKKTLWKAFCRYCIHMHYVSFSVTLACDPWPSENQIQINWLLCLSECVRSVSAKVSVR